MLEVPTRIARRGDQWLTDAELRGHLAALMKLENVAVLLGAGASCGDLGGQTMSQLWKNFSANYVDSYQWLKEKRFVSDADVPNVEGLLDTLEIARLEWTRCEQEDLEALEAAQSNLKRSVVGAALLTENWWSNIAELRNFPKTLSDHRLLLQKLVAARQPGQASPWFFTTNYDLAIEWAAESLGLKVVNGFSGVHLRSFAPQNFDLAFRNALARGEARFGTYHVCLAKLHGSLTWLKDAEDEVVERPAEMVWPLLKEFLEGKSDKWGQQMVFPSAAKYLQTVGYALGELMRRFTDFLARPQACLITCGYSFSDEHLNRVLISALQNPTLHLVVYFPMAGREEEKLAIAAEHKWLNRLAAIGSPQVTIVGDGERAYLSALARDLPSPALYDEHAAKIRRALQSVLKAE